MKKNIIRRKKLVAPFGVGSISDFEDEALMLAGLDFWPRETYPNEIKKSILMATKLSDDRLQDRVSAILKRRISYFLQPTQDKIDDFETRKELKPMPFFRFPNVLYCKKCRRIQKVSMNIRNKPVCTSKISINNQIPCNNSSGASRFKIPPILYPIRFLLACNYGHIDNFPWYDWVHNFEKCKKEDGREDQLFFIPKPRPGLSGIGVLCKKCGKFRSMQGAFDAKLNLKCTRKKPWLGDDSCDDSCKEKMKTMQRGSSGIYFPHLETSILIPPYSKMISRKIENDDNWLKQKERLKNHLHQVGEAFEFSAEGKTRIKEYAEDLYIENINLFEETILYKIKREMVKLNEKNHDSIDYRFREFSAFIGERPEVDDRKDFDIEKQDLNKYKPFIKDYFDNIVLVHQLRETACLLGFTRLRPPTENSDSFIGLSKNSKPWLPAYTSKGEGIFLSFNEDKIIDWAKNLNQPTIGQHKYKIVRNLIENEEKVNYSRRSHFFDDSFLLLHSFSHILMKELSFESGYELASLKERLFINNKDNKNMYGILIFTTDADSEGSLGGIVEKGRPGQLENIIVSALDKASFCSNDPVCLESNNQGLENLNSSACHSCLLLPETSCEHNNLLLDRKVLIGSYDKQKEGFFNQLINNE